MTSSQTTLEHVRLRLAEAAATGGSRSAEEQRQLLADLLRDAFESRHRHPA